MRRLCIIGLQSQNEAKVKTHSKLCRRSRADYRRVQGGTGGENMKERLLFQIFCLGPFWQVWKWRAVGVKVQLRYLDDDGPPIFYIPRNLNAWIHYIPQDCRAACKEALGEKS